MITYKISVRRDFERDFAELRDEGRPLTDGGLINLADRTISRALGAHEKLTFKPGYSKSGNHYYLNAQITDLSPNPKPTETATEKVAVINSMRNRLQHMVNEANAPIIAAAYKRAEASRGLFARIFATRDDEHDLKRRAWPYDQLFQCDISDVDFGEGFKSANRYEDDAETEWKQSGGGLADYPPAAIIDLIEEQVGSYVVLRTGTFEWHEHRIFDPKDSRSCSADNYPAAFAFGELDEDGCFRPIKCHITYWNAKELIKAAADEDFEPSKALSA